MGDVVGIPETYRIALFGQSGFGKTTLLRDRFHGWRAVWLDTLGEHDVAGAFETRSAAAAVEAMYAGAFPIVYRGRVERADLIGRAALVVGDCLVVVEETMHYCPSTSWAPPWLAELSRMGRGYGVSLLYSTQRASEAPRILTTQTTHVIHAGPIDDSGDYAYIAKNVSPAFAAAAAANLEPLSYVVFYRRERMWRREDSTGRVLGVDKPAGPDQVSRVETIRLEGEPSRVRDDVSGGNRAAIAAGG